MEALLGGALGILSSHRGQMRFARVDVLHRKIGAQRQHAQLTVEVLVGVRPTNPRPAQSLPRPVHVRGGVGRLHGRDDCVHAKHGEVVGVNHLGVLHPPAQIVGPVKEFAVHRQHEPGRAVPYGVGRGLKARVQDFGQLRPVHVGVLQQQPR